MANTVTVGNEKEKVEKRRALGRGLESLLPGPRPVPSFGKDIGRASTPSASSVGVGAEAPAEGGPDAAPSTRSAPSGQALKSRSSTVAPDAQIASSIPRTGVGLATGVSTSDVSGDAASGAAELRSAGQPWAAVPTQVVAPHAEATPADEGVRRSMNIAEGDPRAEVAAPPAGQPRAAVPTEEESITIHAAAESARSSNMVMNLALELIHKNPFQTRYVEDDEALEELAESIKANGVVQPIVVRPSEEDAGHYILILGERRLHASKKAGKTHIPALVRKVSLQQAAEMTIVENLQREDLSPLEQAEAFRVLSKDFQLTQQQIGERVGLSRVSVANYMRLLKLPREVMQLLAEKKLNFAQAKELLKLDDNDRIAEAALYAVKKGMNIEQIEMLVLRMEGMLDPLPGMPGQAQKKSGGARWVDPNVRAAQMELERMLGVRVRIRDRKGKGKIVIEYSTVDDYERVVTMLKGKDS